MTRYATAKLASYAGISAVGLLTALVTARPELVAVTAPFLLALGVGLALAERPRLRLRLVADTDRALEGDDVAARLDLAADAPVDRLELYLRLPDGVVAPPGAPNPTTVRLRRGEERTVELALHAARWGGHVVGPIYTRATDPLGLLSWETTFDVREPLRVYPREEEVKRLLAARETQVLAGNTVARRKGEGIEYADIRPFAPGDQLRRVNWRASAVSLSGGGGELWVNEAHPERNTDVIIFLDTFVEARERGESTLDLAVRAAATLADRYLERKDRVGLVGFGGYLNWLLPSSGLVQLYRIIDSLLDLRSRGFDLVVIEVSPVPFAPAAEGEREELAHRLWQLHRETLRARYRRLGVTVVEWHDELPLEAALVEAGAFRRRARYSRA